MSPEQATRLVLDHRPSQPTGWPGSNPAEVYEPGPSGPMIDFKRTLQRAWGAHCSFRYRVGFRGRSKIIVESYNVQARPPTTTPPAAASTDRMPTRSTGTGVGVSYGGDLFILYEPDPDSSDPPVNDDLQWIQVVHAHGRSFVDDPGRANPYYFGAGLTSVYGKPVCSFYDRPRTGVGAGGAGEGLINIENQEMFETFLVRDASRRDRVTKGIIAICGGVKWGRQVQPA